MTLVAGDVYNTDTVKNADGDALRGDVSITSVASGFGFSRVTMRKLFGGFYGYS